MRVALDTFAVGPGMTGIGAYALTLALTLPRHDHDRRYVLVSPDGKGCGAVDAQGRALPVIGDSGAPMWHQLVMPGELEGWDVGVYHSPLFTSPLVKVCQYVVGLPPEDWSSFRGAGHSLPVCSNFAEPSNTSHSFMACETCRKLGTY